MEWKKKKESVKNLGLLQSCYKNVDRLWKMNNQNKLATIVAIFIQTNRYKTAKNNKHQLKPNIPKIMINETEWNYCTS